MSWKDWSRRKKAIVVFVILCLLGVIAFIIYWFGFHNKSPSVTVTPTSAAAMTRLLRSRDNELNPNNDSLVGKIYLWIFGVPLYHFVVMKSTPTVTATPITSPIDDNCPE